MFRKTNFVFAFICSILFLAIPKVDGYSAERFNENNLVQSSSKNLLITKKSGGRSGGGSFKRSKPSKSKSSSGSSGNYSSPRKSTTSSPSSRSSSSDRTTSPSYNSAPGEPLGIIGTIVLVTVFLLMVSLPYFALTTDLNKDLCDYLPDIFKDKYQRERDNDLVTISLIQVVLSSTEVGIIKRELNEISLNANTSTDEGLLKLMQDSALLLLRNELAWAYTFSSSQSIDINNAESEFNAISILERSKFSRETLNNYDGEVKAASDNFSEVSNEPAYVVISLIAGTANDNPLYDKIYSSADLKEALTNIAIVPNDYLMKFELLWTPQQDDELITEEELLIEYSNLIFLGN